MAESPGVRELQARVSEEIDRFPGNVGVAARIMPDGFKIDVNSDEVFPMASVFKIPILVEFLDQVDQGVIDLSQRVTLKDEHRTAGSGILRHMESGIAPTWKDLATLMINLSDNTATDMVLERVGMSAVQSSLETWGLENTNLNANCTSVIGAAAGFSTTSAPEVLSRLERSTPALDSNRLIEREIDTSTSADIANLLVSLKEGKVLSEPLTRLALGILEIPKASKRLSANLPAEAVLGNKTGTIGTVVNDAGIVRRRSSDSYCAVCVFTHEGPSELESERFIGRLARILYSHLYE